MPAASTPEMSQPVEIGFTADEFLKLTAEERVKKCQKLAAEAQHLAETCSPEMRKAYLELVADWRALCEELTKELDRRS